jgi:colanic acid/amylovoran biosynthesis glycosyltransferase
MTTLRLAYLVSRYPAVSHTFILREVVELRRLGISIDVASINGLDRPLEKLTAEERSEAERTFYVKQAGVRGALSALFAGAMGSPAAYLRAFWYALRLGGSDIRSLVYCVFYFLEAAMVARWMRSKGLTHLHVHFATPAATVGLILTKLSAYTLSITVHGPDEFYDVPGYHLQQKIAASRLLCTIGMFARSQLMKISPASDWHKVAVTPLGVDPDVFRPRPFRPNPAPFEILCVGRLVPAKGQHILLSAAKRLHQENRHIRLRFVGDGPDRASLESDAREMGIEKIVVFEGAVNQDRIRDLYHTADVFALASFAEGIPVVLMEAMAMQIPCVTTWITGIPELIRNGVDGLLVPPSDDSALASAIARLMDDERLRETLGEAGRLRVIEKYHLQKNVERLAAVFLERLGVAA